MYVVSPCPSCPFLLNPKLQTFPQNQSKNNYRQDMKYYEWEVYLVFDSIHSDLKSDQDQVDHIDSFLQKIPFLLNQEIIFGKNQKQIENIWR